MAGARLRRRLGRVEGRLGRTVGCAVCRHWQAAVVVGDDWPARPEACPSCGRVVPIRRVRRYVGVRLGAV